MISFSSSFNASYSALNSLDFQLYQHVATLTEKTSTDYCASKVKPLLVYTQQNCHYERKDLFEHLLRSLSYMDVYDGTDTSRLLLYRTYYKSDQDELKKQLLANGYEVKQEAGNRYVYKKDGLTIINKIAEKKVVGGKAKTAYEFELGR